MSKIIKVYLELTFSCNLKCKFCYVGDMQKYQNHKNHLLNVNDQNTLLERLDDIFFERHNYQYDVDILGGESILHKNALSTIHLIKSRYRIRRFTLTSNGVLLDEITLKTLFGNGINELRISLHGTEQIHNDLVGREVFQSLITTLTLCKRLSFNYTIIYVVNKKNAFDIIPTVNYLYQHNILPGGFFFEFVEFSGYAHNHREELNIVYNSEFKNYFNGVLSKIEDDFPNLGLLITNYPKCILFKKFHKYIDDNYNQNHSYELYFPLLARKSLFGFSVAEQRDLIKSHLQRGYKINFQEKLPLEYIPDSCSLCEYNKNCYLLVKETILFEYLGFEFLKRKQYFEINKKITPGI